MKILKAAVAGTLESSDALVSIEPNEAGIEFELDSTVINQFGHSIKKAVLETLENLGVENAKVKVVDKGALDCTLKARVEGAVYRSIDQKENLPWGEKIK